MGTQVDRCMHKQTSACVLAQYYAHCMQMKGKSYLSNTGNCKTGSGCQLKDAAVRVCGAAVNACIYICIYSCICACIYVYIIVVYVNTVCVCVHVYVCMYLYIYTHAHVSNTCFSMGVLIDAFFCVYLFSTQN